MPRRARKPSVRSAPRRETASEGRTRAGLPRAEIPRLPRTLLDASAGVPSARARGDCSLTFLCELDDRAPLLERDCLTAVEPDVVEPAAIARRALVCGDSLYSGEERTRGEPR